MQKMTKDHMNVLIKLQELDIQIDAIKAKLEDAPRKLKDLDQKRIDFTESLKLKESELRSLQKKYRALEDENQIQLSRKKNLQDKLMGVKTNREYKSVLKEIENLRIKCSDIEDEMIQCLEDTEQIQSTISEENDRYKNIIKQLEREKEAILKETESKQKELDLFSIERDNARNLLPAEFLNIYTGVRNRVGRVAVIRVVDSVCRGCHLNIPPQMYNELYRCDSLKFCPHCQRIIYCKNRPEESKRSLDQDE